jgi:hypothetical protein
MAGPPPAELRETLTAPEKNLELKGQACFLTRFTPQHGYGIRASEMANGNKTVAKNQLGV